MALWDPVMWGAMRDGSSRIVIHQGRALGAEGGGWLLHRSLCHSSLSSTIWAMVFELPGVGTKWTASLGRQGHGRPMTSPPGPPPTLPPVSAPAFVVASSYNIKDIMYICSAPCKNFIC